MTLLRRRISVTTKSTGLGNKDPVKEKTALGKGHFQKGGCRNRTRTCDPLINSQLLYRLSYAATRLAILPYWFLACKLLGPGA